MGFNEFLSFSFLFELRKEKKTLAENIAVTTEREKERGRTTICRDQNQFIIEDEDHSELYHDDYLLFDLYYH